MKKITILLGALLLFSVSYAQVTKVFDTRNSCDIQDNQMKMLPATRDVNVVFAEDFEGEFPPADWTVVDGTQSQGEQHWHQMGNNNKYARVSWTNGSGASPQDEWLKTPSITVPTNNPIVRFNFFTHYQFMIKYDNADVNLKISTDDGATWTQLWNEDELPEFYTPYKLFTIDIDLQAYAGQDVRLAFQYVGADGADAGIDNVEVLERPANDLVLLSSHVNLHPEYSNYGYSGFYTKLPKHIAELENALFYFSADIKNRGIESAIPTLKGTLTDPQGSVVVEKTRTFGDLNLATGQNDTVKMWQEEDVFTIPEPILGTYTWDIEVSKEGVTDDIPENNKLTYTTEITDNYYSHNTGTVTGRFSTYYYTIGGEGDALGMSYRFLANDTIQKVNVYVHKKTELNTSFRCKLLKRTNGGDWSNLAANPPITITDESQVDKMYEITLLDPVVIDVAEGERVDVMAAIEYYGGKFFVGVDGTVPSAGWETMAYFSSESKWYSMGQEKNTFIIDLVLGTPDEEAVEEINADNVNIYPNPTNGVFNIENVRGADVEVFNLVGQRVFSAIEVEENISVDLSNLSEGTYVVRISGTNSVKTQKITLVK